MIFIDANILLYAYDRSSSPHAAAKAWLETVLSGDEDVRFALMTLLAFARIATNPAVFRRPLSPQQAIGHVSGWLRRPVAEIAQPTRRHWSLLDDLTRSGQARGPLVMDAHLAALVIEHGASLRTTDRDFARFPGLRFENPLNARR